MQYISLGDNIIEITDNFIITKQNDEYRIIIWNYCYYTDEFANGDRKRLTDTERDAVFNLKNIEINITLDGTYTGTVYTLDESTCAYHNWLRLNAPEYPTQNEIDILKANSKPKEEQITLSDITEIMKPHEVKMYLIRKN